MIASLSRAARVAAASHGMRRTRDVCEWQVLQEFFVIATRKLGVAAAIARRKAELLSSLDLVLVRIENPFLG
jgi:hypothetical protein